jgi:16S rRNA (cytidine1402-2'-O)-methyltransferase
VRRPGALVLCPTPLGNLEDITLRCLRMLREADVIIAEDTRVTRTLLARHDIHTPLRSFHAGNAQARTREVSERLRAGDVVAVVSDAGMPGISDPGSELVRTARSLGARVELLPGPSAVPAAAVLSGFDVGAFRFDGFFPRKPGERTAYLDSLRGVRSAVVWFEAPSRIAALLRAVQASLPERRLFVLREYTKKFEEQSIGTAAQLLERLGDRPRGEFTIVMEGADASLPARSGDIAAAVAFLRSAGLSAKDAAEAIRLATGAPRNELYRLALKRERRT